ncbi:Protein of unknown function [Klenkia soli]|uniref:DUF2771 domain-containing protein n=1 Tax=Klenkia soli TaxID=1052260 RepID=A0A1H0JH03_9ACTN|nr:DUF2771 family protein [Klenkia soli]SDO43067.1 Protein of unknown function [Klenkia soli]
MSSARRTTGTTTGITTGIAVLALVAGCNAGGSSGSSSESGTAPTVRVQAGPQDVTVQPTQYCLAGSGERYAGTPPIVEVSPDSTIALTVSDAVAEQGWSVQVYDDQLKTLLGEVDVEDGTTVFTGINSSDVVPASFYLVVVEDSVDAACNGLSGAWPVGFIRAVPDTATATATATATPTATPTG